MLVWLTITSRSAMGIICMALALMTFIQVKQDTRSRTFSLLMLVLSLYAISVIVTRVVPHNLTLISLHLSTIFLGIIPSLTFFFAIEFLELRWKHWQRLYLGLEIVFITIPTVLLCLTMQVFKWATLSNDGLLLYEKYPITNVLLGAGLLIFIPIALLCIRELRRAKPPLGQSHDQRFLWGILLLCLAASAFVVPAFLPYAVDGYLFTTGSLLLAEPVLKQRLFNPLSEANTQLQRRAEQLSALARIGHKINLLLPLTDLLQTLTAEIQLAFGYSFVAILRKTNDVLDFEYVAGSDPVESLASKHLQENLALAQQSMRSRELALDRRVGSATHVAVPLLADENQGQFAAIEAVMIIRTKRNEFVTEEDIHVLELLSTQVNIAMHNATLYEAAQQAQLEADQASTAKIRFFSVMTHELRTPLQVIINSSKFCEEATIRGEQFMQDLISISSSANQLLGIINNILDWSKNEAQATLVQRKPLDPKQIFDEALGSVSHLVNPNVTLKAEYDDALTLILVDRLHIQQIVMNLLSNACKFTDAGSITLRAHVHGEMLKVSVTDTGAGISVADQQVVFNPFRQAERKVARTHGGTGLGLAICKQLVTLNNGEIGLESTLTKGTSFWFTVPLATEAAIAANEPELTSRTVVFERAKILPKPIVIIDSVAIGWERIEPELARHGYRLLPTVSLAQAEGLIAMFPPSIIVHIVYPHDAVRLTPRFGNMPTHTVIVEDVTQCFVVVRELLRAEIRQ